MTELKSPEEWVKETDLEKMVCNLEGFDRPYFNIGKVCALLAAVQQNAIEYTEAFYRNNKGREGVTQNATNNTV